MKRQLKKKGSNRRRNKDIKKNLPIGILQVSDNLTQEEIARIGYEFHKAHGHGKYGRMIITTTPMTFTPIRRKPSKKILRILNNKNYDNNKPSSASSASN